ncbi:calcium-dependent lipid-binding family protein [Striga asiatica]|uniref:Calcium-dependent lipid-binding family protein n=1 Tax=Striga asiatica TaxID=4170 RepID=A0A5A7QAU8_STRAF|nr:calcium-dependent lipid-binding family protein [Striga asiatica]
MGLGLYVYLEPFVLLLSPMSISGIHGQLLEVTVVACNKLKDTEWISRQDPYVCLEYASSKHRTRTCTDGGKNPTFQEKFVFTLIEGLREISVVVWNSNTITFDDFIGSGKIQLQKVLSQGYDDSSWPLQDKRGSTIKLYLSFKLIMLNVVIFLDRFPFRK